MAPALPPLDDPFGFDQLDLEWLRAKSGTKWHKHPGQLAAWVADMDFAPFAGLDDVLRRRADAHDLGYPDWGYPNPRTPVCELFSARASRRYGWTFDAAEVRELCDVTQGVQVALQLGTAPGDGVILHTPSYPPLWHALEHMGRRQVDVPAHIGSDGVSYDYDELEARLRSEPAQALLLCHPQNPTGHVFGRDELQRLAEIAERHDLLIISDEIHADLTYAPARHVPIASLSPTVAARTVTIHSASKAFNVAGMRYAVAHVGPASLRAAWDALPDHLLGALNLIAVDVTEVAWREGDAWLDAVVAYLDRNRHWLRSLLAEHLPDLGYTPPEATYLAWLDCRAMGDGDGPFEVFRGRSVQLTAGPDFGRGGDGFVRLNFATSASILELVVRSMAGA
ncbi:MAG: MalY/PatB family protein [Ilumatobacteraceae bacterium]